VDVVAVVDQNGDGDERENNGAERAMAHGRPSGSGAFAFVWKIPANVAALHVRNCHDPKAPACIDC